MSDIAFVTNILVACVVIATFVITLFFNHEINGLEIKIIKSKRRISHLKADITIESDQLYSANILEIKAKKIDLQYEEDNLDELQTKRQFILDRIPFLSLFKR